MISKLKLCPSTVHTREMCDRSYYTTGQ